MPAPSDLVHQTTTSTGTGNLTLSSVNGKRTFATAYPAGTANECDYYVSNQGAAEWERGTGHVSAGALVRDTVLASSNAGAAVNFSAGTKDVTNDVPAANQVYNENSTVTDGHAVLFDGTTGRKIKSAGAAPLTAAAQSDMEAESSTVLGVTPGRAHFAPSAVKSWINFNGTGTPAIRVSRNGSSITDNGTGDWTANWTTSFSSSDYAVGAFGRDNDSEARAVISQDGSAHMAAGSLRVVTTGNSTTKFDSDRVTLLCSGDF